MYKMPIIILIFLLACAIVFIFIKSQRKEKMKWTSTLSIDVLLFVLSLIALFTSVGLFMNTAIYVSNYQQKQSGGIDSVTGGPFWLTMLWLELPVLFFLTLILGIRTTKSRNRD